MGSHIIAWLTLLQARMDGRASHKIFKLMPELLTLLRVDQAPYRPWVADVHVCVSIHAPIHVCLQAGHGTLTRHLCAREGGQGWEVDDRARGACQEAHKGHPELQQEGVATRDLLHMVAEPEGLQIVSMRV